MEDHESATTSPIRTAAPGRASRRARGPGDELWRHLVDGELASFWMGGVMTIEPRLNGRVLLHADEAPVVFGTVEELVAGESITWTWRTRDGEPTQVSIVVEPASDGSILRVTEQLIPYEIVHVPTTFG